MLKVISITLKTAQLEEMQHFYEFLGFQFERVRVDKGSEILRGKCDNLELSLMAVAGSTKNLQPILQLHFQVKSVLKTSEALRNNTKAQFMLDPMQFEQGLRCIVMDPDGNSIDLTEK